MICVASPPPSTLLFFFFFLLSLFLLLPFVFRSSIYIIIINFDFGAKEPSSAINVRKQRSLDAHAIKHVAGKVEQREPFSP